MFTCKFIFVARHSLRVGMVCDFARLLNPSALNIRVGHPLVLCPKGFDMCEFESVMVEPRRRVVVCIGQSLFADGCIPPMLQTSLAHAAGIYRRLSQEEGGACIFVSGADVAGDGALQPEGDAMAHHLQSEQGIVSSEIDIDVKAWNTSENAANAIAQIRKRAAQEVVLVTSDFHAPRAAFCCFNGVCCHERHRSCVDRRRMQQL